MTQMDLFPTATSSQPDTRASLSVSQGSKKAQKMTATSGRTSLELLHKKDPLGAFSKMFMVTLPWASTKCLLTWKPKVTPAGRILFQLAVSMPPTEETGSGLWATPDASQRGSRAADLVKNNSTVKRRGSGQLRGIDLQTQVKMWPTPNASDRYNANMKDGHDIKKGYLRGVVKMWPTPTANEDACGTPNGKMQKMLGNHPDVRNTGAGTLNPQWVEWLMGYPEGWTDLKA